MKDQNMFPGPLGHLAHAHGWRIEGYVRAVAGTLILISIALAVSLSEWWLLLTAFVGINLIQSWLTGWCLMSNLLALAFPTLREEPHAR